MRLRELECLCSDSLRSEPSCGRESRATISESVRFPEKLRRSGSNCHRLFYRILRKAKYNLDEKDGSLNCTSEQITI